MKLPYDAAAAADAHNIPEICARFPRLGCVLDLQNQRKVYATPAGIEHTMLAQESKVFPSPATVRQFCDAANGWWRRPGNAE